jgi:chloramphenicol O-acetyltransferase
MSLLFYQGGKSRSNFAEKMKEVNPQDTNRAYAFKMWMKAPMPMVTIFKTLDVSRLKKTCHKHGLKPNMLLCWCIGKAASQIQEFYTLPVDGGLIRYGAIAVNTIVENRMGGISSCDIPFSDNITTFNADYLRFTRQVSESCENHDITDAMVIGTSALVQHEIDGAVGMYSGLFNNPFLIWGRWRTGWFRTRLTISFQFHHTQMDGAHAASFLSKLQHEVNLVSTACHPDNYPSLANKPYNRCEQNKT